MNKLSTFLLVAATSILQAQTPITLEDIWQKNTFPAKAASGFNAMRDGLTYTDLEAENTSMNLVKYDLKNGKKMVVLVKGEQVKINDKAIPLDDYSFSPDETKLLIGTNFESVYRHSSKKNYYVYDLKTGKTTALSDKGKQMFATFSPVGNKVAFVRDNNLFIKDLDKGEEKQITSDGENNKIKNGWADWVYEEEFSKAEAFEWSVDGNHLAYVKYDESAVKEYSFDTYNNHLYPDHYTFKYPKAGENNSIVSVHIYDLASGKTATADIGKEIDIYIPRIQWTKNPGVLSLQRMNRLQNKLELMYANANDGTTKVILSEEAKTYIDITDDLVFLEKDKGFIWSSEKDNYNHLYYYDFNGQLIKQITSGAWDIISFKGFDDKSNTLYYISTEEGAINRDLYSVKLDGSGKRKLSAKPGTTDADFATGFRYYVSSWSNANTPPEYELHSADGRLVKVLEDNTTLKGKMKNYRLSTKSFFKFKTTENVELNGWMMKPADFDSTKKYPVYMYAYNGPGSNACNNQWEYSNYWWHQLLCQEGYIVVCVDGRGTYGRGREFKHSTYLQLGKLETADQIETAWYMGRQSYVDKSRIGFQGWSFGGYLASLLITKGADYFKMAIAVAPVTNWKFYDNIYTERFLRRPQENPSGYEDNSPVNFVKSIKGKFLLVHGSADDNVHYQNSMEMANALVKNNIPFDFMTYPNKNHGIYGGYTRLHLYNKMLMFVKSNL